MASKLRRGQVWIANWGNPEAPFDDYDGAFRCPVLLFSANHQTANEDYPDVVVIPCNALDESLPVPLYITVRPTAENHLPYTLQVECHVFYTIPKLLLESPLGALDDDEMARIEILVKKMLALQ